MKFKGHFKIQAINVNDEIIDQWEDDNMIMEPARSAMSRILAQVNAGQTISKIVLGSEGHVTGSLTVPKTATEGYVKERARLFSETVDASDGVVNDLMLNDIIKYIGSTNSSGTTGNYYKYIGAGISGINTDTINFADTGTWENFGATAPYTYSIGFDLAQTNDANATNIDEDDTGAGSGVHVIQSGSSVTFTTSIANIAGNLGDVDTSIFTEAALYSGSDIFAMKTFKAKIKDSTVLLRITWTITF